MSALSVRLRCRGEQGFVLTVNCAIPARGVTAVYGASGSGKSTLLDCVAGLRQADAGSEIRYRDQVWQADGVSVPPWQRRVGYVFQDARLFPHLDVAGNLRFASSRASGTTVAATEQVVDWLQLATLLGQFPGALSAGQRQRVAIARALLAAPQLLLLDEPLANLDHGAARQCLRYLQRLAAELDLPMLYVSHDIEEVSELADHIILLERGELMDQGSLLDLCSKLDSRLSHEEQAAAIVLGHIRQHDEAFGLTEVAVEGQAVYVNHLEQSPGARRRLRIPARDVSVCRERPTDSSILNILPVTLAEIEAASDARILLRLELGAQSILARITRKSAERLGLQVGDRLFAQIKSAALLTEAYETHE